MKKTENRVNECKKVAIKSLADDGKKDSEVYTGYWQGYSDAACYIYAALAAKEETDG